jgi:hypothetical protein
LHGSVIFDSFEARINVPRNIKQFIMEFLQDLWKFMKARKKWWLAPLIIVLLLIGVLIVLGGSSAIAPFIYTLF